MIARQPLPALVAGDAQGEAVLGAELLELGHDAGGEDGDADGEFYEGNSMTLADILLQAGHPGTTEEQLLEEDELQGDMSDWE